MNKQPIVIFWFRRDLRVEDNHALYKALASGLPVLPIFIFDPYFFDKFPSNDRRFNLIYGRLKELHQLLHQKLLILKATPIEAFEQLIRSYNIAAVYTNEDYEPIAIERDNKIATLLKKYNINLYLFKDQVIFHKNDILNKSQKPFTIFTPYKNAWLSQFRIEYTTSYPSEKLLHNLHPVEHRLPAKNELGIVEQSYLLKPLQLEHINQYKTYRDIPALDRTSYASVYLRFGFISIRKLVKIAFEQNTDYLNELIWREFFMQILYHFPHVENENFNSKYNRVEWQFDEKHWQAWCTGNTGYPIVDAGMRQLLQTGYMHNRIRMIVASFLTKHLLIDWRLGEAFFAQHLLDYDLSANNGNWQWAASTGCDAVPYFRIFNPLIQQQKFDPEYKYIKAWIPDFNPIKYLPPIVNHEEARNKALDMYKKALR